MNDAHALHPIAKDEIKPCHRQARPKNSARQHISFNGFGLKQCFMLGASNNIHLFASNDNRIMNNNTIPFLMTRSAQSIEGFNSPLTKLPLSTSSSTSTSSQQQIESQQKLSSSFSNNQTRAIVDDCCTRPRQEDSVWMCQGEDDRLLSSQQKTWMFFCLMLEKGTLVIVPILCLHKQVNEYLS